MRFEANVFKAAAFLGFFALLAGLDNGSAANHERVSFGPEPAWVVASTNSFRPMTATNSGEVMVVLDKQVKVESGERFYRIARKILNRSGAQNASPLTLSFDPTFESFCFHRLE